MFLFHFSYPLMGIMEVAGTSRSLRDYNIMSSNLINLPTHETIRSHTASAVNNHSLSTALTVISANIEGVTASKASILSVIHKRKHCHRLCLQETHISTNLSRPKIARMPIVAYRPNNKYGSAIVIRDDLKVENVYAKEQLMVKNQL